MGLQINDLVVEQTLSASTMTATTLYVGTNSIGGSVSNFNTLSATTFSAGTIYSAGTDLYNIFLTTNDGNDITRVQPGLNITTGGTANNPTVNLVASPSVNSLIASGASSFTTLSATTLISGSTNLYSIFATIPDQNDITRVQPGTNITTGGTANNPTVNLVDSPSVNSITASGSSNFSAGLSASTLSGGTIFSGSSNLGILFATPANITSINAQLLTKVNDSGDTFTGAVIINSTLNVTGATNLTTLSATTMISGSTNLYNIFALSGGTLIHKSGTISGSTFAGNPKKATVTFSTAFANTSYAITILSDTNRTFTWESKAAGSFVINANANTGFASGNIDWTATQYGEK